MVGWAGSWVRWLVALSLDAMDGGCKLSEARLLVWRYRPDEGWTQRVRDEWHSDRFRWMFPHDGLYGWAWANVSYCLFTVRSNTSPPWPSNTTSEVFHWTIANYSLERLTERSVGLVANQPRDIDKLTVTLLE